MIRVIRKKNPKNYDILNNLTIKKLKTDTHFTYIASYNNIDIGFAIYSIKQNNIAKVEVKHPYRRNGIASFLYDYIENDLGIKLYPSDYLLADGEKFWDFRFKND